MGLFGSRLESLAGSRATDITLEGHEPVFPGVAKITFIIPIGGLRKCFLEALALPSLDDRWKDVKGASISFLGPADPGGSKDSYSFL